MNAFYPWAGAAVLVTAAVGSGQSPPPLPPAKTAPVPDAVTFQKALAASPAVDVAGAELSIDPEAARVFATKVQPVLMNLCANCHCRPDHPSGFKLTRVPDGYANAPATNRNLRATAGFIRPDAPAASPLLLKAVSPHGGAKDAPLFNRGQPAFKHLEAWAAHALLDTGVPAKPAVVAAAATVPAAAQTPVAPSAEPAKLPPLPAAEPASPTPVRPRPNLDDPFDPAAFNRARGGK